jgi:asparagine synthetase B (glutamine-hydrolysing)
VSGILGLLDPDGPDESRLERASRLAPYRGIPRLFTEGPFTLGVLQRASDPGLRVTPGAVLAAHGRVDGLVNGDEPPGLDGLQILDAAISSPRLSGLMHVAADQASARLDRRRVELTLARDAFGMKPLYWARAGNKIAFASDPGIVADLLSIRLEIDEDVVTQFLARREDRDDRTAFLGVKAVEAGHWMSIDAHGRARGGPWFRPADMIERQLSDAEAVDAVAEAVEAATESRIRPGTTGLLLSSGRDSTSIAVAARRVDARLTCLTHRYDNDLDVNEGPDAERAAHALGHEWLAVDVPSRPPLKAYQGIPSWAGTPCGYLGFPEATAPYEAAAQAGLSMVLNGEGGEPLFSASPVVVLDLLRCGRVQDALSAARTFHASWTYPYVVTMKAAVRASLPGAALRVRERARAVPPWVRRPVRKALDPTTAPRSERSHLLTSIRPEGGTAYDLDERLAAIHGFEMASPFLDLRVVRVAVNSNPVSRAPIPEPKPILARAFLAGLPGRRRKVTFGPYYRRLAESAWGTVPSVYGPESHLSRRGLVDPVILSRRRHEWPIESLALVPAEMWLAADGLEGGS